MSWQQLEAKGKIRPHQTSKLEIDQLRAVVKRDLEDAAVTALSADRRFATAYNAALQLSKMVVACAGYRVAAQKGHHMTSFEAIEIAIGPSISNLVAYFDTCRRKRNHLDYDAAGVISETESDELLTKVLHFKQAVETWIADNHAPFAGASES